MAPTKSSKTAAKSKPEAKAVHPSSRKASQIIRRQLRIGKLASAQSKRNKIHTSHTNIFMFFFHALPDEGVLSLDNLHSLLKDVWLTRHDADVEAERSTRRKGRPKSVKEMKLEEVRLREMEEYRTGMEIPDLTHLETVQLYRRWDQKELAFIQLLRFVKIFRDEPLSLVVTRPGQHYSLLDNEMQANSVTALT